MSRIRRFAALLPQGLDDAAAGDRAAQPALAVDHRECLLAGAPQQLLGIPERAGVRQRLVVGDHGIGGNSAAGHVPPLHHAGLGAGGQEHEHRNEDEERTAEQPENAKHHRQSPARSWRQAGWRG